MRMVTRPSARASVGEVLAGGMAAGEPRPGVREASVGARGGAPGGTDGVRDSNEAPRLSVGGRSAPAEGRISGSEVRTTSSRRSMSTGLSK